MTVAAVDVAAALQGKTIIVLGHRGMVGSAIVRALLARKIRQIFILPDGDLRYPEVVDVRLNQPALRRADVLFLCAARVGGIQANSTRPGEFIYDNLMIQTNVIESARAAGVKLLVFLGSSCIYPASCSGAIDESMLMAGPLEPTNSAYAMAKLAGIEMCRAYRRQHGLRSLMLMPCNLYGPGDNYDLENCHVLPALIRRFHEAKLAGAPSVTLWGSGNPRREFMHVDDLAEAALHLVAAGAEELINVGPGDDLPICGLASVVREAVGYRGSIQWDQTRPEGVARKLLDVTKLHGWRWNRCRSLYDGVKQTYEAYCEEHK